MVKVTEKARYGEKRGFIFIPMDIYSLIHCLLWVLDLICYTRPCCIPNPTFFPVLSSLKTEGGNFTQTWMEAMDKFLPTPPPFVSVLDSQGLEIAKETRKSWIQLESVEFSLFELT